MCNFMLRFLLLQTFMFYVTFPTVCVLRGVILNKFRIEVYILILSLLEDKL